MEETLFFITALGPLWVHLSVASMRSIQTAIATIFKIVQFFLFSHLNEAYILIFTKYYEISIDIICILS